MLKIQVYDIGNFDDKTITEEDSVTIVSAGVRLHIKENKDGSLSLQTMSGRKGRWGDTCIIHLSDGNGFVLDTKGNDIYNKSLSVHD